MSKKKYKSSCLVISKGVVERFKKRYAKLKEEKFALEAELLSIELEREKAKGLLEALETLDTAIDWAAEQNATYAITTQDVVIIRQALSDYKQK